MKRIFDLYIHSSIHVGLSVASFTGLTYLIFNLPIQYRVLFFTFFATITGYNYIKYAHLLKNSEWKEHSELRVIFSLTLFSSTVLIILLPSLLVHSILLLLILGLFVFLYPYPFPGDGKNLRNVTGLKIFIIAIVWSGITVFFPLLESNQDINTTVWSEFVQRSLFVILLTLPFDLRDLRSDFDHVKTIPSLIGIRKTKILALILAITILIIQYSIPVKIYPITVIQISTLVILVFTIFLLPVYQSKYFASFWIEGIPIFYFAFSLLLSLT